MSGVWSAVNGVSYLEFSAAAAAALSTGAFSIATLWQQPTNNDAQVGLYDNGPTEVRSFLVDSFHLYSRNDFTAGFGTVSANTWYVGGVDKAAGAGQAYNYHLWPYAADGSGVMQHGTTGAAQGDGVAASTLRWGTFGTTGLGNGTKAVMALWARQLSTAEWNSLKSNQLSAWAALTPDLLVDLSTWNGTTGVRISAGTSTFLGKSGGAIGTGTEPPSFNYSLGSSYNPNNNQMMFFL